MDCCKLETCIFTPGINGTCPIFRCQRNFYVALPAAHPLADRDFLIPQQLSEEAQIVFNNHAENSFGQWASGIAPEERVICTVNTAQAALDLVAAGVGICMIPEDCAPVREDIRCIPVQKWYQGLYMCILYDKWLEPPVWWFVEQLVKVIRSQNQEN